MSPKYKLTYFDVKALAEPIRFLFHYAKVEFEDVRIPHADWPALKPQMPWNVLPVLEEDGKQLSQSLAIFRYLGRKFGLAGSDEWTTAKANEYIDAVMDVRMEVFKLHKEVDEGKKAEMKKNIQDNTLPKALAKFNEILKQNGTGFLVGKDVTYADIYVAFMFEWLEHASSGFLEFPNVGDYPEVLAHQKKILNLPGIKEWIEKRPVTQF